MKVVIGLCVMEIDVPENVWSPTNIGLKFAEFVNEFVNHEQILLDLGCGSGIIGIVAAKKGAKVFASDISTDACIATAKNAVLNEVNITIKNGNCLAPWEQQQFDIIVCNSPNFDYIYDDTKVELKDPFNYNPLPYLVYYCCSYGDKYLRKGGCILTAIPSCHSEKIQRSIFNIWGWSAERKDSLNAAVSMDIFYKQKSALISAGIMQENGDQLQFPVDLVTLRKA